MIPGLYFAVDAPEFYTHAAGMLFSLNGAPTDPADEMGVTWISHPDTSSYHRDARTLSFGFLPQPAAALGGERSGRAGRRARRGAQPRRARDPAGGERRLDGRSGGALQVPAAQSGGGDRALRRLPEVRDDAHAGDHQDALVLGSRHDGHLHQRHDVGARSGRGAAAHAAGPAVCRRSRRRSSRSSATSRSTSPLSATSSRVEAGAHREPRRDDTRPCRPPAAVQSARARRHPDDRGGRRDLRRDPHAALPGAT